VKREHDMQEYFLSSMKSLINDKLYSDLLFLVPGNANENEKEGQLHKIYAHKSIVTVNSPILKALVDKRL
jgi:hypothetical protein